jgi:hypothetical protein
VVLDELDAFSDPVVARACDDLQSITTEEGGVPFMPPTARAYPHAPWWECDDVSPASLNPTAAIVALLHKQHVEHPWATPATAYCWRTIEGLQSTSPYEARAMLPFLDHAPDRERAEAAFERIGRMLLEQGIVALDSHASGEVHLPLDFAPRPQSMARRLFSDEVIAAHLDALIAA